MVRFNATQAVWKNSEDEILKAAVMKYGLNQWGRVASLFAKRTAKQCKARWDEWLDPSIKKTEWSRDEDEKLLHLAKLMPTQWRTIAPLVGRTAAQCLERYERLLDEAAGEGVGNAPKEEEEHSLKTKRVAASETLPAKPDAIDMDEEELEMISEARARLANTLGKKAKRKARERQLEEQQRMTRIQKRREMKAAGLSSSKGIEQKSHKRRRKNSDAETIDYTSEIPFEQPVPKGPYDISMEKMETARRERDEQARIEKIAKANQLKAEKNKSSKKKSGQIQTAKELEAKLAAERKKNEVALAIARGSRGELNLPSPLISDAELEDVAKAAMVNNLVAFAPPPLPSRKEEVVRQEARNQLARDGKGVVSGQGTGFQASLPLSIKEKSVLPSLASRRTFTGANGRVVLLRDELGINKPNTFDEENLEDAEHFAQLKSSNLLLAFSNIPQAEYEYSVQIEGSQKYETVDEVDSQSTIAPDARELQQKRQKLMQEKNIRTFNLLPSAVKLNLPELPAKPLAFLQKEEDPIRKMVLEEKQKGLLEGNSSSVNDISSIPEIEEVLNLARDNGFSNVQFQESGRFDAQYFLKLVSKEALKISQRSDELRKFYEELTANYRIQVEDSGKEFINLFREIQKAVHNHKSYIWMKSCEEKAITERIQRALQEVNMLSSVEQEMQRKWAKNL